MLTFTELGWFALAALILVLTPGPNMIYCISRTLVQGRRAGLLSLAGVLLGFVVHLMAAALGLTALLMAVPYKIHTVLTDNGVQFVQHDKRAEGGSLAHVFARVCAERGVEHRLTKPYHPWTNGQAERMVRTIKDATVRAFHTSE